MIGGMSYTTTRENGELRQLCRLQRGPDGYTTTRENGELRQGAYAKQNYASYTTTRENGELRRLSQSARLRRCYTTTRENGELRPPVHGRAVEFGYTTTRENGEQWFLPQCPKMISHILYPHFPPASIPKRKGPGLPNGRGRGCRLPGGLWHILDKRGNLG